MIEIPNLAGIVVIADRRRDLAQHFVLGSWTVREHYRFGAFQKNGERRH